MLSGIAGYDLVMSISQKALNQQFQLVFPEGAGLPSWEATLADDGSAVTGVTFATPSINLNTPLARGAALILPIRKGTYSYYQVKLENGKPVVVPVNQDLAGTSIKVTTSLKKYHDEKFSDKDFTIQRIFLDLSDPHLASDFEIDLQGQALVNLTTLFMSYLQNLASQNSSTFLFGSVKIPNIPASQGPLAPTGADFAVYSSASDPDVGELQFLLETDHKDLPTGPGVGDIGRVIPAGQEAAFFVSGYQLISKFILPSMVAGMQKKDPHSPFSIGVFTIDQTTGSGKLNQNVGYDGGWFSKWDCYIANNEVVTDIEYRKEKKVIIDSVTGIGDVSVFISVYVNADALQYKTSQTKVSVHSDGSSLVWRIFQDIFTLGFAEIGEKVVTDAVDGAVGDLLGPGSLGPSVSSAINLIQLPAPTLFTDRKSVV